MLPTQISRPNKNNWKCSQYRWGLYSNLHLFHFL